MSQLNLNGGQPPTNPAVVKAMKGAAIGDNPNTRGKLYNALLEATFLLPAQGESNLLMARSESGNPMMLLFTDEPSLTAWQEVSYIALSASNVFALAAQHNIEKALINPAGPDVSGELTAYELQALGRGLVPGSPDAVEAERILAPREVRIAEPTAEEQLPEIALRHIRSTLAQHDAVQAAYIFMMAPPEQEPSLVGGVVLNALDDPSQLDRTMRTIVSTISPALHDRHMDFMVLHGDLQTAVEQTITPFYTRSANQP